MQRSTSEKSIIRSQIGPAGNVQGEIIIGVAAVFALLWAAGGFSASGQSASDNDKASELPMLVICRASRIGGGIDSDSLTGNWRFSSREIEGTAEDENLSNWSFFRMNEVAARDSKVVSVDLEIQLSGLTSSLEALYGEANSSIGKSVDIPWLMKPSDELQGKFRSDYCKSYASCYAKYASFLQDQKDHNASVVLSECWKLLKQDPNGSLAHTLRPESFISSKSHRAASFFVRKRVLDFIIAVERFNPDLPALSFKGLSEEDQTAILSAWSVKQQTSEMGMKFSSIEDLWLKAIREGTLKDYHEGTLLDPIVLGLIGNENKPGVLSVVAQDLVAVIGVGFSNTSNGRQCLATMAGVSRMIETGQGGKISPSFQEGIRKGLDFAERGSDPLSALVLSEIYFYAKQHKMELLVEVQGYAAADFKYQTKVAVQPEKKIEISIGDLVGESGKWRFDPASK